MSSQRAAHLRGSRIPIGRMPQATRRTVHPDRGPSAQSAAGSRQISEPTRAPHTQRRASRARTAPSLRAQRARTAHALLGLMHVIIPAFGPRCSILYLPLLISFLWACFWIGSGLDRPLPSVPGDEEDHRPLSEPRRCVGGRRGDEPRARQRN